MSNVLEARGLHRRYPTDGPPVRAVDGVDMVVEEGETVSVMGPSGCGKSTLLHLLGGLERPDAGELWLGGRRVDGLSEAAWAVLRRRAIGFVFQAFHLVDELTSVENVELPALLLGVPRRDARRRAMELLERLDVARRAGHLPDASPAASASGWRSPARWSTGRWWCWPTSRPATWTAAPPAASSSCSRACTRRARRC
jgi:putative ABC transport system ATP-binding protein